MARSRESAQSKKFRQCWSWETCPLAHHQFKEPRENRPERETEHQRFGGMQKIAELTYMALMVHPYVRKVGDSGEPKHPPQNTKDDPPSRSRQAVSPPLRSISHLFLTASRHKSGKARSATTSRCRYPNCQHPGDPEKKEIKG